MIDLKEIKRHVHSGDCQCNYLATVVAQLEEAHDSLIKLLNTHVGITPGRRILYGECQCDPCKQARRFIAKFKI